MRARYYDPASGRFISRDPVEGVLNNPQSQNGYSYAHNDPVNLSDPSGEQVAVPTNPYVLGVAACIAGIAYTINPSFRDSVNQIISTGVSTLLNSNKTSEGDSKGSNVNPGEWVKNNFNNPNSKPGPDWEWRGPADKGSWYNPKTGESLHPDLGHGDPQGPHWDYVGPKGEQVRIDSSGKIIPK